MNVSSLLGRASGAALLLALPTIGQALPAVSDSVAATAQAAPGPVDTTGSVVTDSVKNAPAPSPEAVAPVLADSSAPVAGVTDSVTSVDSLPAPLLASKLVSTKTVVVKGKLRGRAQDARARRDSDVRKDVIGQEALRDHADADAASTLSHSSGVTLQRSQGEGRYVQIRGTEARLSSVSLNGQKLSTSASDTRAVALDVIPVDQLSQIEVTKVLMPEMDGDAIGGAVNLVTPTAQDSQLVFKGFFATGWNSLPDKPLWQGSLALSRRFLDNGALGAYLGGSWFRSSTGSDAVGISWDTLDRTRIWELELRRYRTGKERQGLSGRLDWRAGASSLLWLTGTWNRTENDQTRLRLDLDRTGKGDLDPYIDSSVSVEVARDVRHRVRTETVGMGSLGATTELAGVRLEGTFTASHGSIDQPLSTQATFVPASRLNIAILPDDPSSPDYYAFYYPRPATQDPRLDQAANYVLSRLDPQSLRGREDDVHGRLDLKWAAGADSAWQLKAGAKFGLKEKSQSVGGYEYTFASGAKMPTLADFSPADFGRTFYHDTYAMGPMPDAAAVDAWLAANRSTLVERSQDNHLVFDPQDYEVRERHTAAYGQARWGDGGIVAVGGLRYERFDLRSTGNDVRLQADESWDTTVEVVAERTMDFWLPMLSVRWEMSPGLLLRSGATRTFVLPDVRDLVPTRRTDLLDYTIEEGNPDLKPTTANALDLGIEWFRTARSLVSVGLFAKQMEDYVFPLTYTSWDPIRKVVFTHYGKANGDDATLLGAEFELVQPLDFLPGFLGALGVEANWTRTWSSTSLPGRTGTTSLPGQADQSGTLGLRFERWGFSSLVSWTFQGSLRHEIASVPQRDTWVDSHARLDLSVSQRLARGWTVFAQAGNLTDAAYRIYENDRNHPVQIEYAGITGQLGLRVWL